MHKHYHFEQINHWDIAKKRIKSFLYMLLGVFFIYSSICIYFVHMANKLNAQATSHFFKRRPDLIAVFTGDHGRIEFALNKSKEYKQTNIFITGVYSKNTVRTILNSLGISDDSINTDHFELDYLAKNTLENVIFTYRYLEKRHDIQSILIISHDYHIPRIRMIINELKQENLSSEFFYAGIPTNYYSWRNIKLLYTEVFKLLRTYGFLILWDPEAELKDSSNKI